MREKEKVRIRDISDQLYAASKDIRILTRIGWDPGVRDQFFESGARNLPQVKYQPFDPDPTIARVAAAKRLLNSSDIDAWLRRQANVLESSARMLAACGTADFFKHSCDLYGSPNAPLPDESTSALGLANEFSRMLGLFDRLDLGAPAPACHLADAVGDAMSAATSKMFGAEAPEVLVVDSLSANALAGPRRIRIRRSACFTDKDIGQLIQHEAYVHVATSLNGLAQPDLKILAAAHPGTTKTQEGLAVFAEFITGTMDLDRMRRLADRVIAIQMAIDGGDFLDVYKYFQGRTGKDVQAFENATRVFRGGVVEGGAPFTKDIVYLDGLLRVHDFLKVIVSSGRGAYLRLLFSGKLDLEDIPVIAQLVEHGLCREPKYVPPWAADLRFLLVYLSYSSYLNRIDTGRMEAHYNQILDAGPVLASNAL